MKKKLLISSILTALVFFTSLHGAHAADSALLPNPLSTNSVYDFLLLIVRLIIRWFVYPGIIAMWVWSGFAFVAAQGNPEKLVKARSWLMWAAIVTVVVFMTEGFLFAVRGTVQQIVPNMTTKTLGTTRTGEGATGSPLTGAGGQAIAQSKSPISSLQEAIKPEKLASTLLNGSKGCKPDSDGTTYHEDPKDPSQCLPDSECAPGYEPDPSDSTSCKLMDESKACPAEDGVTYTLGTDGQCHPTNGGCPPGESPNASDICVSDTGSPTDQTGTDGTGTATSCPGDLSPYSDGSCPTPTLGSCPAPFETYQYSNPDQSDCPKSSGTTESASPGGPVGTDSCDSSPDPFKCRCDAAGGAYDAEAGTCG